MVHHVSTEDRLRSLRGDRDSGVINAVTWGRQKTDPFEHLAPIHPHAANPLIRLERDHAIEKDAWDRNAKGQPDPGLPSYRRQALLVTGCERGAVSPFQIRADYGGIGKSWYPPIAF